MRAISLHQPHASAVALLSKLNETRGWATEYRGPLLIHAALRCVVSELQHIRVTPCWRGALAGTPLIEDETPNYKTCLPFGAIIAVCNLVDCRPTGSFTLAELRTPRVLPKSEGGGLRAWTEEDMGNFALGRFGWALRDVHAFKTPIPYKGCQRFFDVPECVFKDALPETFVPMTVGGDDAGIDPTPVVPASVFVPNPDQPEFWPSAGMAAFAADHHAVLV